MNYAIIENNKVINTIVSDENFANSIGAIYCSDLPIGIGDFLVNNQFVQSIIDYDSEGNEIGFHDEYYDIPSTQPIMAPQELREQTYQTMQYKEDGTMLIEWENGAITVDQANELWLAYSAEGNTKANELSALIVSAKAYIRELYPDE